LHLDGAADDFYRRVEVEKRSIELLRSWLTPDQLRQFDEHGWFIVRGGDTGERYRINYANVTYNVHQLDDNDHVVQRFCVVPAGNLPVADVMLAQKTSLENMELDVRRVANRRTYWSRHTQWRRLHSSNGSLRQSA
jgi:hypothetical protein